MKKLHLLLLCLTICLFTACHDKLWDAIDDLDVRVARLEELCKEMNTNITSLQTIVSVLQSNDFITSIVEIKKNGEVIGYTITFGKHDPITIYHGQNGKDGQNGANGEDGQDGQNGADGKDGSTPVIGVAQDTDGVYYWTLNGEWLLDDNGNKLPVSGKDGKDGANGTDGKDGQDGADGKDGQDGEDGKDGVDGQDGTNGKDGITPQLKIEDGYWYISYDNGVTWKELGKATGEDGKDGTDGKDGQDGSNGKDGADGKDGKDGYSMFQSVTQDENYVYFTLADGTVIKIAKRNGTTDQPDSDFIFTITYDPNGGEGVMKKDTFYYGYAGKISACTFWREGYYYTGYWNTNPKGTGASYKSGYQLTIDRNIVLYAQWEEALGTPFEWVDLGLSVKWATCNVGASKPEEYGYYFAWGETQARKTTTYNWSTYKWCNGSDKTITKYCTNSSYGIVDNKTVLDREDDATAINWGGGWRIPTYAEWTELCNNCSWSWTTTNGVVGRKVTGKTGNSIFLPAAGIGVGGSINFVGRDGNYIINSYNTTYPHQSIILEFDKSTVSFGDTQRCYGCSARPVCP